MPLNVFFLLPLLGFVGFHHILEAWYLDKLSRNQDTEETEKKWKKSDESIEGILMVMTISVTFGTTIAQNFGFIFKLYLYLIGESSGILIILTLIFSGIYIIFILMASFFKSRTYNSRKYPSFAIYLFPLVILVEKIGSIMFIIVMLLQLKLFFFLIHLPIVGVLIFLSKKFGFKFDFKEVTEDKDDKRY
jgi:hypothetical protein